MDKLFLIGKDVGTSRSSAIYQDLALVDGVDMFYYLRSMDEEDIEDFVKEVRESEIKGFNVTAPFKTKIFDYIDEVSEEAKKVGAVNTVVNKNGVLKGYNTDIYGIKHGIEPFLEEGKTLILGRGGAAKALVEALKEYELYVYSRDDNNQDILSVNEKVKIVNTLEDLGYVNVINATTVGFNNKEYLLNKPFKNQLCAVDLIYTPEKTEFLRYMEEAGVDTLNGYPMLKYQAERAYELFYNKRGKEDD